MKTNRKISRITAGVCALGLALGAAGLPGGVPFIDTAVTASAASLISSGKCGENVAWTLDSDGKLEIYGSGAVYRYKSEDIIPWYSSKNNITKVIVGDGVESVQADYFYHCGNLRTVKLGKNVLYIGDNAFRECKLLTTVILPEGLKAIDTRAFGDCTSLESVTLPKSVTEFGVAPFFNTLWQYNKIKTGDMHIENNILLAAYLSSGSVKVPKDVNRIAPAAFVSNKWITEVTIPSSVEKVDQLAFFTTPALKTVHIEEGVKKLDKGAFLDSAATEFEIPASVTEISEYAIGYTVNPDTMEFAKANNAASIVIKGKAGSTAEQYANANGLKFVDISPLPAVKYGDVNSDGEINDTDVALLQQYLADWKVEINKTAADVTGDGKVDESDIGLLQQYLADWKVTLKGRDSDATDPV